jgi:ribonuclease HII
VSVFSMAGMVCLALFEHSVLDPHFDTHMQPELIAGIDEVGRGPLAGPVIAAAVILDPANIPPGLADSKKLSETRRNQLAVEIRKTALAWALGRCEVAEIDELNILQASLLAMTRAVQALAIQPIHALVDGNKLPDLPCTAETIIKGDSKIPAISAASILAKVERDAEMVQLHLRYPQFGFDQHKGYPTAYHRSTIIEHGPCSEHRRSFRPVREALELQLMRKGP